MYQISKEQKEKAILELAEAPAKYSFNTIAILQNLPEIEEKKKK